MGFFFVLNRELERRSTRLSGMSQVNYTGPSVNVALLILLILTLNVRDASHTVVSCLLIYTVFAAAYLGAGAMAEDDRSVTPCPASTTLVKWAVAALPLCVEAVWTWSLVGFLTSGRWSAVSVCYALGLVLFYTLVGLWCAVATRSWPASLVSTYACLAALLLGAPLVMASFSPGQVLGRTLLGALAAVHPLGWLTGAFPTDDVLPGSVCLLGMVAALFAADVYRRLAAARQTASGLQAAALIPSTLSLLLLETVLVPLVPRRSRAMGYVLMLASVWLLFQGECLGAWILLMAGFCVVRTVG